METKPHGSLSQSSLCQSHSHQEIVTTDCRPVSQDNLHFPSITLKDTKGPITLQSSTLPSVFKQVTNYPRGDLTGPKPLHHRTSNKTFTFLQKYFCFNLNVVLFNFIYSLKNPKKKYQFPQKNNKKHNRFQQFSILE